jgi:carbon-monoxide dehydrogenase medium subunit
MSLIPLMKLRLASPESVIDLRRVPGLKEITESGGVVRVGAMATHHDIEGSPVIRGKCPLLGEAAGHIGDTQVRNVGTIGGSVAHADPSADYPAALVALEARIRLRNAQRERLVEASEFFVDAFTTAMEPGEIVVAVEIDAEEPSEGYKYEKVPHPASGFPVVGVAARIKRVRGGVALARIGVTGMGAHAFRARKAEALLEGGADPATAAALVGEGEEANSDLYASGEYRRHLAQVHAARAIAAALTRAS